MRRTYAISLLAAIGLALMFLVLTSPAFASDGYDWDDWIDCGTPTQINGGTVTASINDDNNSVYVIIKQNGRADMAGDVEKSDYRDFDDIRVVLINIDRDRNRAYLMISRVYSSGLATLGTTLSCSVIGQKALGGDKVVFPIVMQNLDDVAHTYTLSASSDTGWALSFVSAGKKVYKMSVPGKQSITVDLEVQTSAATGIGEKRVTARVDSSAIDLYVDVTSVNHTADLSAKAGSVVASVGDKVLYELSIKNSEARENDYKLAVSGLPDGWYYRFKESTASVSEISEVVVPSGADKSFALEILPPYSVEPGDYSFTAMVTTPSGDVLKKDLSLRLKSGAELSATTPKLAYDAKPGEPFEIVLYVSNNGHGVALTNVQTEVTAPSGWVYTASPNTTSAVAAGTSTKITVKVTPPGNIVASEYPLSIKVKCDQGAKNFDYNIKVSTDSYIPYIGAGIILIVIVGLVLVVRKYGRR
jgi:Predicted membrane protein